MKLLRPDQVAEAAQLSEGTVLRLAREGRLPGAKKIGGTWRIVEDRFVAWLAEDDGVMVQGPRKRSHESNNGDEEASPALEGWQL